MASAYDSDLEPTEEGLLEGPSDDYDGLFEEIDYLAIGVDPAQPTDAKPGSEDKVLMLAARYAAGLPLWHNDDRYDHGPGQIESPDFGLVGQPVEEDE